MDIRSKDEFVYFMQRACEDTSNDCYIELYNILLRAFISADADLDGAVSEDEFEGMINAAAAFPQKFGFEFWKGSGKDQFKAIDADRDGQVSQEEFGTMINIATAAQKRLGLPAPFQTPEEQAGLL